MISIHDGCRNIADPDTNLLVFNGNDLPFETEHHPLEINWQEGQEPPPFVPLLALEAMTQGCETADEVAEALQQRGLTIDPDDVQDALNQNYDYYGVRTLSHAASLAFDRYDLGFTRRQGAPGRPLCTTRIINALAVGEEKQATKHRDILRVQDYLGTTLTPQMVRCGYELGIRKPPPVDRTAPPPWTECTIFAVRDPEVCQELSEEEKHALTIYSNGASVEQAAKEAGVALWPDDGDLSGSLYKGIGREALGTPTTDHAMLMAIILGEIQPPSGTDVPRPTPRQREILSHIASRRTYEAIATILGIATSSVDLHMQCARKGTRVRTVRNMAAHMFSLGFFVRAKVTSDD